MQQQNHHAPAPVGYAPFSSNTMSNGQQGYMAQLDATTAALLMNPHTAAAVAAVAAAAQQMQQHAQQMHHQQQHAPAHQQHFQILSTMPPGVQQMLASSHSLSPAPGLMSNSQAQHSAAADSSTPPSPQPGQQPSQASQSQGASISLSQVSVPGQQYPFGVPPHVAAMMGFPPGAAPETSPHGANISNGTPTPQHTMQLSFPSPAAPAQTLQAPPPIPSNSSTVPSAAQVSSVQYSNGLLVNMQHWKLHQLEAHVSNLQNSKQPVPQPIAMLLADARRKEDKRTAKRVANRKSACTSRARKKALVEEMTRTNARLRRQALILSLLPDLVIAITVEGEITFCSAQVERVLRYPIDDLLGANLTDVLVPASQQALSKLIGELVAAERAACSGEPTVQTNPESPMEGISRDGEIKEDFGNATNAVQSFPLSVVKVKQNLVSGGEENSDLSTSNNGGVKTESSRNCAIGVDAPSFPSGEGNGEGKSQDSKHFPNMKKGPKESSSDESFSSCSDAKQIRKANENLSRNVRWHNEQMNKKVKAKQAHLDDVLGAFVTANNADARLSSLQHRPFEPSPKKAKCENENEEDSSSSSDSLLAGQEETRGQKKVMQPKSRQDQNSSDDSGYRESHESAREDTSSTESESSSNSPNGGRPKPLAPTCNICLIRDDLTTIWCEVTSSIRTRSLREEISPEDAELFGGLGKSTSGSSEKGNNKTDSSKPSGSGPPADSSDSTEEESSKDEIKELLLCLRPIRDGEEAVSEALRFIPVSSRAAQTETAESANAITICGSTPHASNSSNGGSGVGKSVALLSPIKQRPPKKRPMMSLHETSISVTKVSTESSSQEDGSNNSRPAKRLHKDEESAEKSVVESLMLMSSNTN